MQLKLVSSDSRLALLEASGHITPDAFSREAEPMASLLGPEPYGRRVLLGMGNADYINSSGVGWLLVCHKRFRDAGGRLVIHTMPKTIQTVFEVLKLDQVFHLAHDLEAARRKVLEERPS